MWMDGLYVHSGISEVIEPDEFIVEHTKAFDNYEDHTLFDFLLSTGLFFDDGVETPNYVIKFGESKNAYTIRYNEKQDSTYNKNWRDFISNYITKNSENGITEWGIKLIVIEPNIPFILRQKQTASPVIFDIQLDDNIFLRNGVNDQGISMSYIINGVEVYETTNIGTVHIFEYSNNYDISTIPECDTILVPFISLHDNDEAIKILESSKFKNRMLACHDYYFKGRLVDHVTNVEYQDVLDLRNISYSGKCIKMNDMCFYIIGDNAVIRYAGINSGEVTKCFIEHTFDCVRIR